MRRVVRRVLFILSASVILCACGGALGAAGLATSPGASPKADGTSGTRVAANGAPNKITLGAYTTPREAYAKVIPLFKQVYKSKTGKDITFEESYLGSGAQSRAIVDGFDADVAALSLESDIDRIAQAGLITHDWKSGSTKGIVSTSLVAFAVRKGNPKGIHDWADLTKPGIEVLTPNPKTSGGAQWNIMGLYGAALRGQVQGVPKDDEAAATTYMKRVLKNVSVMDKGARESMTTFERGVGDVAITYENEVVVARMTDKSVEQVLPASSIVIENPIALVDIYVDRHGNRPAVEAFLNFLYTPEAQRVFAEYGLRSVDKTVAQETASMFPTPADPFTIQNLGGWKQVTSKYFGDSGIYTKAVAEVQK